MTLHHPTWLVDDGGWQNSLLIAMFQDLCTIFEHQPLSGLAVMWLSAPVSPEKRKPQLDIRWAWVLYILWPRSIRLKSYICRKKLCFSSFLSRVSLPWISWETVSDLKSPVNPMVNPHGKSAFLVPLFTSDLRPGHAGHAGPMTFSRLRWRPLDAWHRGQREARPDCCRDLAQLSPGQVFSWENQV